MVSKEFCFMLDNDKYFTNQKCFILTGNYLEYLVAFFNSKLFRFCFWENFPLLGEIGREVSKIYFDKIPVLKINQNTNEIFKNKVIEIQKLKQKKLPTKDIELEIDKLIFKLYGLTEEEKTLINQAF
jgi:hypothetical protein